MDRRSTLSLVAAGAATRPAPDQQPAADLETAGYLSVKLRQFGAKGDGRTDDLPALLRASESATALGHGLLLPRGVYRVTGPWLIGNGVVQTLADSLAGLYQFDPPAERAAEGLHRPTIVFDPGAAVWGDFEARAPTPIIDYQLAASAAVLSGFEGGIVGAKILGRDGWRDGRLHNPPGDDDRTDNPQVGLHTLAGCHTVERVYCRELGWGLVATGAFSMHISRLATWRCRVGARLPVFNGGRLEASEFWYGEQGIDVDGASFSIRSVVTENIRNSLNVGSMECASIVDCYFEDLSRRTDGRGAYEVTLGGPTPHPGPKVNHSTLERVRCGPIPFRKGKKNFRLHGAAKLRMVGCRHYQGGVDADSWDEIETVATDFDKGSR